MSRYEYKVVPAPAKGTKARGVKTPEGRFALSVESVLNQMGAEGWEYLRAELLPSDERTGLTGTTTNWRNVLVFRRLHAADTSAFQPRILDTPVPVPVPGPAVVAAPSVIPAEPSQPPRLATGAERMLKDNGVEELSDVAGMTAALSTRAARQSAVEPKDDAKDDTPEVIPDESATGDDEVITDENATGDDSDSPMSGFDKAMRNTKAGPRGG
jgi:hypothetical protein